MYLEFYNLREKPFTLSPNPKYMYYSRSHKEALSQMIYAISQDSGFMALIGEVGTGKTMLVNTLIRSLPRTYFIANLHYTALTPKGLIQAVCREFGLTYSSGTTTELVFKLQEFFQKQHQQKRNCVLIIDEAQNLSAECLETIRLLTNTRTVESRMLQILFVGQPELEENLSGRDLRQIHERIALKYQLRRLEADEIRDYIRHRISVSREGEGDDLFDDGAVREIHEITEGIPRRINIVCDNALICGYSRSERRLGREVIDLVRREYHPPGNGPAASGESENGAPAEPGVGRYGTGVEPEGAALRSIRSVVEDVLCEILERKRLHLFDSPGTLNLIIAVAIGFVICTLSFLWAIFLAVKLDIIQ